MAYITPGIQNRIQRIILNKKLHEHFLKINTGAGGTKIPRIHSKTINMIPFLSDIIFDDGGKMCILKYVNILFKYVNY